MKPRSRALFRESSHSVVAIAVPSGSGGGESGGSKSMCLSLWWSLVVGLGSIRRLQTYSVDAPHC